MDSPVADFLTDLHAVPALPSADPICVVTTDGRIYEVGEVAPYIAFTRGAPSSSNFVTTCERSSWLNLLVAIDGRL
jgi:hypothetical protein